MTEVTNSGLVPAIIRIACDANGSCPGLLSSSNSDNGGPIRARLIFVVRVFFKGSVAQNFLPATQEQYAQHPGDESPRVRPVRHAFLGQEDLPEEPEPQEDPGRKHGFVKEDPHRDAIRGKQEQIASEDAPNSTGRTEGRNCRLRIDEDVGRTGEEPPNQIKNRESEPTECVLDVRAKDQQEDHVSQDMSKASVQEHARKQCDQGLEVSSLDRLHHVIRSHREVAENHTGSKRKSVAVPKIDSDVERHESVRNVRDLFGRQVVANREHLIGESTNPLARTNCVTLASIWREVLGC